MKFISVLFAVLAIVGLGQAHPFPDFGSGPLHEDVQDFLDLVPSQEISNIVTDYVSNDPEVQAAIDASTYQERTLEEEMMDFLEPLPWEKIVEIIISYVEQDEKVLNALEYMFSPEFESMAREVEALKEYQAIVAYLEKNVLNVIDSVKTIGMQAYVPQIKIKGKSQIGIQKIGDGMIGMIEDLNNLLPTDKIDALFKEKMQNSKVFADFIGKLISPKMQKLAGDLLATQTYQNYINTAKENGLELVELGKLIIRVIGLKIDASVYQERTLEEEMMDFVQLLPIEQIINIAIKYAEEDEKVQNALQYLFSSEFESITREVEALKEYQAIVAYMEKNVLNVINSVKTIGMQAYVPHKIKGKSQIGIQKIGDGMIGMIKDLNNLLPTDKIDALFKEKMQNSKVFADFIEKLISPEMQKLAGDLLANQTYQNFINTAIENGLELVELGKLIIRVIGLKI